ncbi:hypothetical protein SDC9_205910 [bioreactor metagenome]|uniref:Uncharacterized protein n=1 Tax=bioreactor metagenome TaxID=1076179 RepID=A0A645J488_9ZZZZ
MEGDEIFPPANARNGNGENRKPRGGKRIKRRRDHTGLVCSGEERLRHLAFANDDGGGLLFKREADYLRLVAAENDAVAGNLRKSRMRR